MWFINIISMNLSKEIWNLLCSLRKSKNISQEKLAFKCKVHRTYIWMIERWEKNITMYSLVRFLSWLWITLVDFFILLDYENKIKNENKIINK